MKTVSNPHTATMVKADPRRAAGRVDERVQNRPVANRIQAIFHRFGLTVGADNQTAVEVVAANHNWCFHLAQRHQFVKIQPGARSFSIAQLADARGQPLKLDIALRHANPAHQMFIVGEELKNSLIGGVDIFGVAREGHPAEGAFALAEERANVGGDRARVVKRVCEAIIKCALSQIVAIIKHNGSFLLPVEHSPYMGAAVPAR